MAGEIFGVVFSFPITRLTLYVDVGPAQRAVSADDPHILFGCLCTFLRFFGLTGVGCAKPASVQTHRFLLVGMAGRFDGPTRPFLLPPFLPVEWISVTPLSSATVKERAMRHPRPVFLISINSPKIPTVSFCAALFFFSFSKSKLQGLDRWRRCRLTLGTKARTVARAFQFDFFFSGQKSRTQFQPFFPSLSPPPPPPPV